MDFTKLPHKQTFKYLLVYVFTFSGWVEAFPCKTNNAKEVVRVLLKEIIPRVGIPWKIGSDDDPILPHK